MNVLIACEESQRVCEQFRLLGHQAFSCDILECGGPHPEWHIKGDVLPILNGNCSFTTQNEDVHILNSKWDLIIAHPPCTFLTITGNRWFNVEKYGDKARQRMVDREEAVKFFMAIVNADCDHICIENPVGIMSTRYRKPDQIIQPYMFGDAFEKRTCLWLIGLNKLIPTNEVTPEERVYYKSGKSMPKWYSDAANLPPAERAKVRSRTFPGIAQAIAEQFSEQINRMEIGANAN